MYWMQDACPLGAGGERMRDLALTGTSAAMLQHRHGANTCRGGVRQANGMPKSKG